MTILNFKLYEISNEYERAIDHVIETDHDEKELLSNIKENFSNKCINVAKYIKNLESEYEAIKKAELDMKERANRVQKHIDSLTFYLQYNMEKTGLIDPIKCPEFEIKLHKNPACLIIEDETLIPDLYVIKKEIKNFDKNAIKKDILEGFEIDGARIEQKIRLVIK